MTFCLTQTGMSGIPFFKPLQLTQYIFTLLSSRLSFKRQFLTYLSIFIDYKQVERNKFKIKILK